MAYLLGNLKTSLEQTKERLTLLNERGVEALNILYPGLNYGGMLYYQLLESLPKEIEQLEKKIKDLEHKQKLKTNQLSDII
ncbi:hypothetical protein D1B31_01820 [Neobacillus notoginsengisoli]|uniref:Uncharacterized protein n=2 Tax=Neobacillus notoginsengisoli TaxID=1578198 RepID=A0A417YZX3_9BACI|nr:hypothetical protein D1B31_01820 [Neobacillus notoginsengisoli]